MIHLISRGEKYPLLAPKVEGATAEFLTKNGNTLKILLPGIDKAEENALRYGVIKAGFLFEKGAILWLFEIHGKKGPLITLDAPFDARLIPSDLLDLPSITNAEQRLVIDIHAMDENLIVKALRGITFPPDLTLEFFSAVQDQLAIPGNNEDQYKKWLNYEPINLIKLVKLRLLGG